MPPRRRPAAPHTASLTPDPDTAPRRATRGRVVKAEPEPEPDLEADREVTVDEPMTELEEAEDEPRAGPSRRARGRGRGRRGGSAGAKRRRGKEEPEDENSDEGAAAGPNMRIRKSVSYREVPVELEEEDDEVKDEGEDQIDEVQSPRGKAGGDRLVSAPNTPSRRARAAASPGDEESPAESFFPRERVGTGRGGFSVKGAAAAAARARWAKVRAEKVARGEDSDDDRRARRRPGGASKRESRPAADTLAMDSTTVVKGVEYTVGDDELILPDDEKGDNKVDAEGRLLGGREYKLVTFPSESRRNPEKMYALTIDVARACGYTDSLAFLRRCPTLLKLACNQEERQMLIDIGRVTGNLKHRMVTMVTMRNVYKVMGARVVKNGRWVQDDYYEAKALAKCAENGFTPNGLATDDDLNVNAANAQNAQNRLYAAGEAGHRGALNLAPFYTLGGPTTTFGGSGSDPWSEAGWGNKRAKLRGQGVSEEDWMYRTSEESRRLNLRLREYRVERLQVLEGVDGVRGWVYAMESRTDGEVERGKRDEGRDVMSLRPAEQGRKPSMLSREVIMDEADTGDAPSEGLTPLPPDKDGEGDVSMEQAAEGGDESYKTPGGRIVVQSEADELRMKGQYHWGAGEWTPGLVRAVYEPHTHMPHVPLWTQSRSSGMSRLSPWPVIASLSDAGHRNFVQSTVVGRAARGLASVEYVFERGKGDERPGTGQGDDQVVGREGDGEGEKASRLRVVEEAVEWEREMRKRRRRVSTVT